MHYVVQPYCSTGESTRFAYPGFPRGIHDALLRLFNDQGQLTFKSICSWLSWPTKVEDIVDTTRYVTAANGDERANGHA
eukprot:COSAG01_NODE_3700_length_5780_cov_207.494631_4_plen_79_part_00